MSRLCLPNPSMPAQELALNIVKVVEVNITMIELPVEKIIEERAIEIIENILQNSVMANPVKIKYLSITSDKVDCESDSDDDEFVEMKDSATKSERLGLPEDSKRNVTIWDGDRQGKSFKVKESNLLGLQLVFQQTYHDWSAE